MMLQETSIDMVSAIQRVFEAQKKNAAKVKLTTAKQRIEKLKALEQIIFKYRDRLHEAIHKDFAKPATEFDMTELMPVILEIRHTIRHLPRWMKPRAVATPVSLFTTSARLHSEAKGVALIIAPWNYPFSLTIAPLVSAIAAGNCCILKPSEFTAHTTTVMNNLIKELFSEEEIAVFEGGAEVSTALLALPFDHIFFTGSPAVGKIIMKAASQHLASVTLELGGKSPAVIDESADIEDTAQKLAWGKFINAGQTCIAPDYVLVREEVKDKFLEAMAKNIRRMFDPEGKGTEQSQDFSRIVNHRHYTRLNQLLDEAVAKGATVHTGGKLNTSQRFIEPTVVTNVTPDMKIMQEEIFGPLMPVISYRNTPEAIALINTLPKALAMYIFSRDKATTNKLIDNTSAGGTCVNETLLHFAHTELPFGGVNNSGIGKSHGYFGFQEFSNLRPVLRQRVGWNPVKMMYPPYTGRVKKLMNQFLKWGR